MIKIMKITSYYFLKISAILSLLSAFILLTGCDVTESNSNNGENPIDLQIVYPKVLIEDTGLPMILKDASINPRRSIWTLYSLSNIGSNTSIEFLIKRGCGSVTMNGLQGGEFQLFLAVNSANPIYSFDAQIKPRQQMRELSGILSGNDLLWDSTQIIHLMQDITIPVGNTLIIGNGTSIISDFIVSVTAIGNIEIQGTAELPVYFTASDNYQPWGEIYHQNSSGNYNYVFFTQGGGDDSRTFGHSHSQPVIGGDHCTLTFNNVYIIDNPGKAIGLTHSVIQMDSCLISRCDTGGELIETLATIENCYFVDMPNGDSIEVDDDNDGLYLFYEWSEGPDTSSIIDCVFASGKDDGIDHNGAVLKISHCVIEDFDNEGVAASNSNGVVIFNTLISGCEQGIEAGYGWPTVVVNHCTLLNNQTGLRFGDWYNWGCHGSLEATNTVVFNSSLHNVYNYDILSGGPKEDGIIIAYSLVNQAEYDSGQGCVTGTPIFDEEYKLMPGSPGYNSASDGLSMGIIP
jgi:hypothetical protein